MGRAVHRTGCGEAFGFGKGNCVFSVGLDGWVFMGGGSPVLSFSRHYLFNFIIKDHLPYSSLA